MESIQEALSIILGDKSLGYYIAGFFFSFLAIVLSIYHHSTKRDVYSANTPMNYSVKFLVWDNTKRAVAGLILMFIIFRIFDCSNILVMVGVGFFVSFGVDKGIQWLMTKSDFISGALGMDRNKFKK
jgi:hypothetical protein